MNPLRPRRFVFTFCVLLAASFARADLSADIQAILQKPALKNVAVGVHVVKLGATRAEDAVLFDRRGDRPLIPASNLKLVSTAAALDQFGSDFQFRTVLAVRGNEVALIGDGDPAFGDAELLKPLGWKSTTIFSAWADVLKKRGITKIEKLVIDDSVFDQTFIHPNWPTDQEHLRYVAGVGGLNLNANCLDFYLQPRGAGQTVSYNTDPPTAYADVANTCTIGKDAVWLSRERGSNQIVLRGTMPNRGYGVPLSVTIHDPSLFAGTVLAETLRTAKIEAPAVTRDRTVRQNLTSDGSGWQVVAVYETPIAQVIDRANKDSMNLYAEALCKRLGFLDTGEPGSWTSGTAAIGKYLTAIGVPADQFSLDDGCGLSKKNAIAPAALAKVLAYELHGKDAAAYFASLSVGGQDGTLEKRFGGTTLGGRVHGKSGYVNNVSTLSGVIVKRDNSRVVFSIMMNNVPSGGNGTAKQIQEAIVSAIDAN